MKKIKMFALSVVVMLLMVNFVSAETKGATNVDGYASLKEAITNTEVTTITLTNDIVVEEDPGLTIPSGRTIVIDLNGKTLSMTSSKATTSYLIKNQGSLTIKDSTDTKKDGTGNGKITYSSTAPDTKASPVYASNTIANSGTIILESGVLENSTAKAPAAHVIDNYSGGKITINGGKVNSVNNWAIRMFINSATASNDFLMNSGYVNGGVKAQVATSNIIPKASFIVNAGTMTGKTYGFYLYDSSTKGSNVNVEINGGNFSATGESGYAAYIYSKNAHVEINDGTFTGTYALLYFTYYPYDETTHVINDGTFNGIVELDQKFTTNPEENYKSNFRINNGKFSSDVYVWGYDGTDWYLSTNTQFIHGGVFAYVKDEEGNYYWPNHIVSPYEVTSAMKTTPNGYSYTLGHKITLNANYEGGKNTTIYTLTNGSMSELEEIKRDRYEFKGWNTKSDGTGETITSKSTLTVATTLYAQWVKIENKVNVATITNGTVVVDKTKAGVDETVTITITPAEGYELSTLKVVDAANKELTLTDNKFVMPNSEVTVTATFTKLETTVTLPSVDITEEVEEVVVGVQESEVTEEVLLESLEETLKVEGNEELAEAVTKENTVVVVEVEALETEKVEETVAKEMEKAAGKATIATYFDIMVAVRNAEKELLGTVPELTKEIELVVLLPEELKNADKTIKRDYYIIRQHDEEIKKIPATLSEDGNYLIFKSNKFSTYALAYEDTTNPQTFDGVNLYVVLGGLALISIIGIAVFTKKNKVFN